MCSRDQCVLDLDLSFCPPHVDTADREFMRWGGERDGDDDDGDGDGGSCISLYPSVSRLSLSFRFLSLSLCFPLTPRSLSLSCITLFAPSLAENPLDVISASCFFLAPFVDPGSPALTHVYCAVPTLCVCLSIDLQESEREGSVNACGMMGEGFLREGNTRNTHRHIPSSLLAVHRFFGRTKRQSRSVFLAVSSFSSNWNQSGFLCKRFTDRENCAAGKTKKWWHREGRRTWVRTCMKARGEEEGRKKMLTPVILMTEMPTRLSLFSFATFTRRKWSQAKGSAAHEKRGCVWEGDGVAKRREQEMRERGKRRKTLERGLCSACRWIYVLMRIEVCLLILSLLSAKGSGNFNGKEKAQRETHTLLSGEKKKSRRRWSSRKKKREDAGAHQESRMKEGLLCSSRHYQSPEPAYRLY